ncbi:O-antigen ligase family protein [Phormidium tenue]|uniref:O-antigen ligase family protein n=1 Tax=Phormidium tenue FACHB-1050 TaxID=2692857 RepID=A0ABR8CF21_9CYAN|nr:O-antigen ligase family protein [Phormidium tenue]MBD2319196.1 O-antigen ligase family protein [Phormidium tenue FACHB-1050]
MNPILNLVEQWFTVFSLIFFTGILRWASLFVSPDAKAISANDFNPFDPINAIVQYLIYAIALFFLLARKQSSIRTARGNILIWLLPVLTIISFLWSDFPDESLRKGIVVIQTSYFGLYFASRFTIKQQLHLLAWTFGIVAVLSLLFGIAFSGASIEAGANAGAFRGPFTQKNLLARVAVLGAIVFLINALNEPKYKFFLWAGFALNLLLVLASTSKTALLLLLMVFILLPLYKALRWKSTITIPLVVAIVVISGSLITLVLSNWELSLNAIGRDATLSGRVGLWEGAIEKIIVRPWVGYGYQAFWREDGGAFDIWLSEGYKPPHAHNGFINVPLDLGLIGLSIFLAILAINYVRSIIFLRSDKTVVGLWPIYYITFFFMYNHSENTIIEHNSIFWILLVSTILSVKQYNRNQIIYSLTSKSLTQG